MKYITENNALLLLKQLVETPSFVTPRNPQAEKPLEDVVKGWFSTNLPSYKLTTIPFAEDRNNLFFCNGGCKWIFACHLDTVPPFSSTDLNIKVTGDRVYGLGTKDMKGGTVSTLLALKELTRAKKDVSAGVLFYGDEEYAQQGIRALERNYQKLPKPKLMISPESRFNLGIGARGMCIIKLKLKGKRAHSSRPHLGVDAIKTLYKIVQALEKKFEKPTKLGKTTLTIVEVRGGLLADDQISVHYGTIPDIAEATISLRVAQPKFNVKELIASIKKLAKQQGATLETVEVVANYPARITNFKQVQPMVEAIKNAGHKAELGDPGLAGYNDMAILSEKMRVPLVNFGPYGENNHNPNEWVSLKSIIDCANVYLNLMK